LTKTSPQQLRWCERARWQFSYQQGFRHRRDVYTKRADREWHCFLSALADPDYAGSDDGMVLDNFSISLSLVPEPSTWLAGALAVGAIAFSQRRRIGRILAR